MRPARTRVLMAVAGILVAALLLPAAPPARAGVAGTVYSRDRLRDWDDWDHGWDDYFWYRERLQSQAISAQEEAAREAGRERRRDELERERQAEEQAREEYFDAVVAASQAALKAPRGVYYRRPGFTSDEAPPPSATPVTVGGKTYLHDRGVFWVAQGGGYLVVPAPFGAVVKQLPKGAAPALTGEGGLEYFMGAFYRGKDGAWEVVRPPPGVAVTYLPDGYLVEPRQGAARYRFGPVLYQPVFIQGVLAYQVTAVE